MAPLSGKTILITGATNGIGRAAARELARAGATIALVGRNPQRIATTVAAIRRESGNGAVNGLQADLSLLSEVRQLAAEFQQRYERLDVLLNNAGAVFRQREDTAEGFERTFALNHLSYFLLTNLLLDLLQRSAPARVINVASTGHHSAGHFDFENIDGRKSWGGTGFPAYALSKLANILFTRELARRLEGSGVTANALHPGTVLTDIWKSSFIARIVGFFGLLFMRRPERGAETMVWLATAPEIAADSGGYYVDCQPAPLSRGARDDAAARRLWELSVRLCGLDETPG